MSSIVAVAGGSRGLGRSLAEELKRDGRYQPLILSRKTDAKFEEETGIRVLAIDYSNIDSIVGVLEANKIDTVISTISTPMDATPEFNLISAADRSTATRRYVANSWSAWDYKPEHAPFSPVAAQKLAVLETMRRTTSLEWTSMFIGLFMEWYAPALSSYVQPAVLYIDVGNNEAGIPLSGDDTVRFTYTRDVARFTIAALSLPKLDSKYYIVGDTKTWNEVVALAEQIKGVKFKVAYDSAEKLAKGEVTELESYKAAYDMFGGEAAKPMVHKLLAQNGLWIGEGLMKFNEAKHLNDIFPAIKPITLQEGLEKSYVAR